MNDLKNRALYFFAALTVTFFFPANVSAAIEDSPEIIKTGWSIGAMPSFSYSPERGLQYGGQMELYYFGDGTGYPKYRHSVFTEITGYTKGGGNYRLFYDSEHVIPKMRLTSDLSYFTNKTSNFYGFNGYNSLDDNSWDNVAAPFAGDRFFNIDRSIIRFTLNFQGNILGRTLRWTGGAGYLKYDISRVTDDHLPTLYDKYLEWGVITDKEKYGGNAHHVRFGIIYDTRDNEPNPMSGMWSEVVVFASPRFLGNGDFANSRISATHRQYFTIVDRKLSFVYRLNYQGTLGGTVPFYMLPYQINSFSRSPNTNAPGGSKTIRGITSNRVVGEGLVIGNLEMRWIVRRTVLFNRNVYLALNSFIDSGRVVSNRKIAVPSDSDFHIFYRHGNERMHTSAGGGFRIAVNENLIYAVDYGKPFDKRDGGGKFHIGMNFIF
jgi:hypothetical protein